MEPVVVEVKNCRTGRIGGSGKQKGNMIRSGSSTRAKGGIREGKIPGSVNKGTFQSSKNGAELVVSLGEEAVKERDLK